MSIYLILWIILYVIFRTIYILDKLYIQWLYYWQWILNYQQIQYNTRQNIHNAHSFQEMEDNIQREIANMSSHDFCHKDLWKAMYKDWAHTSHKTLYVSITMNNWQMLYWETTVNRKNHTKYINTFWGEKCSGVHIQGVPGGMCQTSGGCFLC